MNFKYRRRRYGILSLVLTIGLILSPAASVKAAKTATPSSTDTVSDFEWPTGPDVYADGAIVMEASTGLILYQKDIYSAYYPASITKIMTTLLAIENCNLNETMTMSHAAEWDVDFNSSRIGLVEGESLLLKDALYGVMLESANEVSYGVAEHVGGGDINTFLKMMNDRAKELGAVNTNFTNPHGLHDDNHYTCAYDMALISRAAIALPEFRTITGTRTYTIPATNKNVARPLANHHRFIKKTMNYDGAIGGKTGGTTEAKTTLVTFAQRNGLTLIAVVLHVDTGVHAYEDTAKMLDFAFDNYALYNMQDTNEIPEASFPSLFADIPELSKKDVSHLSISTNSNIVLPLKADYKDAVKTIEYTPVDELVHGNNVIGKISYTYAGKYVGSTDIIYYNEAYPLTKGEFEAQWPDYLVSPETLFANDSENGTSTDNANGITTTPADSSTTDSDVKDAMSADSKKSSKLKPIVITVVIIAIILVAGYYIVCIELPHRRRRKNYYMNHKKRMDSMRRSNSDEY